MVTAEASFRGDVAVEGERIAAVGVDLPTDGADVVDVSGALLMPGFIDGHTHLDMPFGGTVTSDDWDTGTAAAVAGGTTTLVDFSLQDIDGTLAEAVETWQGKAEGRARIDYGLHVAITNLTDAVKAEIPRCHRSASRRSRSSWPTRARRCTPRTRTSSRAMQIARQSGVLVLVHAEDGDVIAQLQAEALERGTPFRTATGSRGPSRRGRGDHRAIRLAEIADTPLLVVHVSCAAALEEVRRAHPRGRTFYAETCPSTWSSRTPTSSADFDGAKYVCSPPMRDPSDRRAVARAAGRRPADLAPPLLEFIPAPKVAPTTSAIPDGCPAWRSARRCCGTEGVRGGHISESALRRRALHRPAGSTAWSGAKGLDCPRRRRLTSSSGTPNMTIPPRSPTVTTASTTRGMRARR